MAEIVTIGDAVKKYKYRYNSGTSAKPEWSEDKYTYGSPPSTNWRYQKLGEEKIWKSYEWDETANKYNVVGDVTSQSPEHYDNMQEASAKKVGGGQTDWGAGNITKDMFIKPDGSPREIEEIYNTLDPLFPNLTGNLLKLQIRDMLPKYQRAPEEEVEHAKQAYESDIYGIQKEARGVGAAARNIYGGMASGVRDVITGAGDVAQQFKQAGQGLAKDMYGLTKTAGTKFESGISEWMQTDWFSTPDAGVEETTPFRKGGKIPKKEDTFLEILNKLPDAKGS